MRHVLMSFDIEKQRAAQKLREKILNLCVEKNPTPDVMVMALADILGDTAAALDRIEGYQPIRLRLAAVVERAVQTYDHVNSLQRSSALRG